MFHPYAMMAPSAANPAGAADMAAMMMPGAPAAPVMSPAVPAAQPMADPEDKGGDADCKVSPPKLVHGSTIACTHSLQQHSKALRSRMLG